MDSDDVSPPSSPLVSSDDEPSRKRRRIVVRAAVQHHVTVRNMVVLAVLATLVCLNSCIMACLLSIAVADRRGGKKHGALKRRDPDGWDAHLELMRRRRTSDSGREEVPAHVSGVSSPVRENQTRHGHWTSSVSILSSPSGGRPLGQCSP